MAISVALVVVAHFGFSVKDWAAFQTYLHFLSVNDLIMQVFGTIAIGRTTDAILTISHNLPPFICSWFHLAPFLNPSTKASEQTL